MSFDPPDRHNLMNRQSTCWHWEGVAVPSRRPTPSMKIYSWSLTTVTMTTSIRWHTPSQFTWAVLWNSPWGFGRCLNRFRHSDACRCLWLRCGITWSGHTGVLLERTGFLCVVDQYICIYVEWLWWPSPHTCFQYTAMLLSFFGFSISFHNM